MKCGGDLSPAEDSFHSDDPYYAGGARCRQCHYLYFPEIEQTWCEEAWHPDYVRRKKQLRAIPFGQLEGDRRRLYLAIHFINCLWSMLTTYFDSAESQHSDELMEFFYELNADDAAGVVSKVLDIAKDPLKCLSTYDHLHYPEVEDTWLFIGEELGNSLPTDLDAKIYACMCKLDEDSEA